MEGSECSRSSSQSITTSASVVHEAYPPCRRVAPEGEAAHVEIEEHHILVWRRDPVVAEL
jgi:hypothetical protein